MHLQFVTVYSTKEVVVAAAAAAASRQNDLERDI